MPVICSAFIDTNGRLHDGSNRKWGKVQDLPPPLIAGGVYPETNQSPTYPHVARFFVAAAFESRQELQDGSRS